MNKKMLLCLHERILNRKIPYEAVPLALMMLAGLLLPAVNYTYNGVVYRLTGMHLLTGLTIAGGTIAVPVNGTLWMIVACALAVVAVSLLLYRKNRGVCAQIMIACAMGAALVSILFSMRVESMLSDLGAKRVGALYGYLLTVCGACLTILDALLILRRENKLPQTFDIAGYAVATVASLALPFATYTYKKVSHPYTGFDMMLHKQVANDAVTGISVLPYLIAALAAAVIVLSLVPTKKRRKNAGWVLAASAGIITCTVLMTTSTGSLLSGAKDPIHTPYSFVTIAIGMLIFGRALHMLYKEKVVSALDFMMVPGLLYLLINNYLPMVGISLAFKRIDYTVGIWNSPWVGLDNFEYLFSTDTAWVITRNTLLYNFVFIVLGIVTGMIVGICLASVVRKAVQTFYQTTILLPQLISMIVVAYIVFAFFSNEAGFVNKSLLADNSEINFYGEKGIWPFLLVFIHNWKQVGYNSVIFLSSIVGIDQGLYEAAMVDGCSRWKQITKITIPQLKPTIITLFLLQTGRVFYSDFGLFYQVPLDSGALYPVTNTIDTYVYRSLMVLNNLSSASAASAFQSVCGFLLVLFANYVVRRVDRENALF